MMSIPFAIETENNVNNEIHVFMIDNFLFQVPDLGPVSAIMTLQSYLSRGILINLVFLMLLHVVQLFILSTYICVSKPLFSSIFLHKVNFFTLLFLLLLPINFILSFQF